jgi:hypothetical protein
VRVPSVPIMLAGVVLTLAAGAADAYTCYVVLDANDNVVSRDTMPPVDMSAQGNAARDALRQSGKYLMIIEVDQCLPLGAVIGSADSGTATPADYMARVRPVMTRDSAAGATTRTPPGGVNMLPPPPPAPAPAATGQRTSPGAY